MYPLHIKEELIPNLKDGQQRLALKKIVSERNIA